MGIMGSGCAFNKGYRSTTDGRMAPLTLEACFIRQPGVLKPPYYHILIYIVTYYSYYSICHMCCLNSNVSQKEALSDSEFSILCKKDELTRVIVITYYYIKSLAPGDRKSVLKLPGGLSPSKISYDRHHPPIFTVDLSPATTSHFASLCYLLRWTRLDAMHFLGRRVHSRKVHFV